MTFRRFGPHQQGDLQRFGYSRTSHTPTIHFGAYPCAICSKIELHRIMDGHLGCSHPRYQTIKQNDGSSDQDEFYEVIQDEA
jgi:hypothetical protein